MKTARIIDVCISEKKGVQKVPAERIEMRPDWGIEGDAHAGNWHRQVSLLAQESVDHLQRLLTKIRLKPGDFGENIVTEGIVLYELPVGTRMRIG
ncbi:MAG: MOSC domain-containing protein, partial [Anaerovoracaceae bacterium]